MATLVGTQSKFSDALFELCELDLDAIEAYQAAIEHLENPEYIKSLSNFKSDHERHVRDLTALLSKHNLSSPKKSGIKSIISKGKIFVADLIGDNAILEAMLSNEKDTNIAYERLSLRTDEWDDAKEIISRGLEDERRHKAWIETVLGKDVQKAA